MSGRTRAHSNGPTCILGRRSLRIFGTGGRASLSVGGIVVVTLLRGSCCHAFARTPTLPSLETRFQVPPSFGLRCHHRSFEPATFNLKTPQSHLPASRCFGACDWSSPSVCICPICPQCRRSSLARVPPRERSVSATQTRCPASTWIRSLVTSAGSFGHASDYSASAASRPRRRLGTGQHWELLRFGRI